MAEIDKPNSSKLKLADRKHLQCHSRIQFNLERNAYWGRRGMNRN